MRRGVGPVWWLIIAVLVSSSAGCAGLGESLPEARTGKLVSVPEIAGADRAMAPQPAPVVLSAATDPIEAPGDQPSTDGPPALGEPAREPAAGPAPAPPLEQAPAEEEFRDPFAKAGEAVVEEEYDPWESFNTVMFEFNRKVDRYVLKPVAQAYNFVLPDPVQRSIGNFFHNVRFAPRLINNLLQAKFRGAGLELGRFVVNSTLGLGGLFDPAKSVLGMDTLDEDFGQTLGVYGVKPGPYLVLPFLPPLTLRDATGFLFMDLALDPLNYLVFPVMPYRFAGQPMLTVRDTAIIGWWSQRVEDIVNERSLNLEKFQGVEEATLDLYSAVRNAYLQKRTKAIRE